MKVPFPCLLVLALWLTGCRSDTLFTKLDGDQTGITFANTLTESDSLNVMSFEYIYNGGGVGVGDLNNDGLTDVFFAGNMVSSRLYVNRTTPADGHFRFEDVTGAAGTTTRHWCTGVAMVDINGDGWLDIYVSTIHPDRAKSAPNLLFVNQGADANGVPQFREMAAEAGLADSSYSTQAAFLDYDRDGDLDLFLLTNALENYSRNNVGYPRNDGSARSTDKLFRNDGMAAGDRVPRFTDVTREEGILAEGWGLGVCVKDINRDGWPDIYVANDFQSNDVLYVNTHDGAGRHTGFVNKIGDYLGHQSHNSMGIDIADINNDGLEEIAVVDMMPDDNLRQKTMFNSTNYDVYERTIRQGYQPQFVRNVLQLNQGPDPAGNTVFSDIGYLTGINATDWSWSALFADFDNDGLRDLLITNGYRKDVTDLDFISYRDELTMFGRAENALSQYRKQAETLPGVEKPNFLFRNKGGLVFENKARDWGLDQPSYANGAAYADFDNDGDLDLVMNTINAEAFVYQNNLRTAQPGNQAHYLALRLAGKQGNRAGLGAEITVFYGAERQVAQHALQRGYKSTVDDRIHFGLGSVNRLDSLEISWPGGRRQVLRNVAADQLLTLRETDATLPPRPAARPAYRFTDVTPAVGLRYQHEENLFVDFKQQPTLPHQHSRQGPALAVGDVNGDGRADVYVSGAVRLAGVLFMQQPDATFRPRPLLPAAPTPKTPEETGALFFDADGDGDQDLYVVSGGVEFGIDSPEYQDVLYVNTDGAGTFAPAPDALPDTRASGSCVVPIDFDKDGDLDLFVGGRVTPGRYPLTPRSYLLRNDTKREAGTRPAGNPSVPRVPSLRFTDVTEQLAPLLARPGLVTAALATDYDRDGWPDLLLAGEWMAPGFFRNDRGRFTPITSALSTQVGWWNSLVAGDFDHDGDPDYVAGNLGLNSKYKASPEQPVSIYAKDFDNSGTIDAILTHYIQGKEYPTHPRGTLTDQLVGIRRVAQTYADYGRMTFADMFKESDLKGAWTAHATQLASVYIRNDGQGRFTVTPLPLDAQLAPMNGFAATDYNNDGHLDLLAVGNSYATETLTGRYDASVGCVFQGDGKGGFRSVPMRQSGFCVRGDARTLVPVRLATGNTLYLIGKNADWLQALQ